LSLERGREALVGQQGREDTSREVPQILERIVHVRLKLRKHRSNPFRVPVKESLRKPDLYRQRYELLLRPVVDVPLEPSALVVLGPDQSLLRRLQIIDPSPELLGEADVAESAMSLSFVGSIGSLAGMATDTAPRGSP
jgi:hypothetical protein